MVRSVPPEFLLTKFLPVRNNRSTYPLPRDFKGTCSDWVWHAAHGDVLYQLTEAQPSGYQVRCWSIEAKAWCVRACVPLG